jgi:hypothetical protein
VDETEISVHQMLQWINAQKLQKFNWLADFGPGSKRPRGSLEISQKKLDIAHLSAIERELKTHVRTIQEGNPGGAAPGIEDARRAIPEMDKERSPASADSGASDSDAQRGFDGF